MFILGAQGPGYAGSDLVPVARLRPDTISFTQTSGIDEPGQFVLRDADGWATVWQRIHGRSRPLPPVPAIDFDHEMVVVVALGRQQSGGYTIRVERAYLEGSTTVIIVREESPGEGCIVTDAITSPVDIATLPLSPEPVEFWFESGSRKCNQPSNFVRPGGSFRERSWQS
ncbi:MAG: protease complex subunit PrcB family protein [Burkholderiales bacterium]